MTRSGSLVFMFLCAACAGHPSAPAAGAARCLAAISGDGPSEAQLRRTQGREEPRDVSAWVELAQAWVRVARARSRPELWLNAEDCTQRALTLGPRDPRALRMQGLVFMNAHRFADARAVAQDLLVREPDDALSWGTLSDAELELGHLPEAIAAAQQMLDRKPSLLSYGRAAHLRWLSGDREGAKRMYRAAIAAGREQADPEPRTWLTVQAAWVFWHEGDYAGAARGFELALSQLPDYAPALEGLGRAALAQHRDADAVKWLARAHELHETAETAWALAEAYARTGDKARAAQCYLDVERLGAASDPRTLAWFEAQPGRDPAAALKAAERAFRDHRDWYAKDALALALSRNGRQAEAKRLADEIVALGIPDARLTYHAGEIYQAAGAAAEGGKLIAKALSQNPSGLLERERSL